MEGWGREGTGGEEREEAETHPNNSSMWLHICERHGHLHSSSECFNRNRVSQEMGLSERIGSQCLNSMISEQ